MKDSQYDEYGGQIRKEDRPQASDVSSTGKFSSLDNSMMYVSPWGAYAMVSEVGHELVNRNSLLASRLLASRATRAAGVKSRGADVTARASAKMVKMVRAFELKADIVGTSLWEMLGPVGLLEKSLHFIHLTFANAHFTLLMRR